MPKNIPAAVVHVPLKTRFAYPWAQLSGPQGLHRSSGLMIEILIVYYIDRVRASEWVSKVHIGNNANMSFSYRTPKSLDFGAEDCLHLSEWHICTMIEAHHNNSQHALDTYKALKK